MKIKNQSPSIFIMIGFIFLVMFGLLSWGVAKENGWVYSFDLTVIQAIQSNISESKTAMLLIMTEIGNIRLIIVLTIILTLVLFYRKLYTVGLWFGSTILFFAVIITKILKTAFDRTRPDILPLIEKTTESFPSGHATGTTIFYGLLGLTLILLLNKMWKKIVIGLISLSLIGFILFTRIYLGVHYPSDVIAGFLYGSAVVFISIFVYQKYSLSVKNGLKRLGIIDQSEKLRGFSE